MSNKEEEFFEECAPKEEVEENINKYNDQYENENEDPTLSTEKVKIKNF